MTDRLNFKGYGATTGRYVDIPSWVEHSLRLVPLRDDDEITQIDDDVWMGDQGLAEHTDSTRAGQLTFGLVLLNDDALQLEYEGVLYDLPAGTAYCIDGRKPHAVLPAKPGGRFAFLAWDVEPGWALEQFALLARGRIGEIAGNWRHPPHWSIGANLTAAELEEVEALAA